MARLSSDFKKGGEILYAVDMAQSASSSKTLYVDGDASSSIYLSASNLDFYSNASEIPLVCLRRRVSRLTLALALGRQLSSSLILNLIEI